MNIINCFSISRGESLLREIVQYYTDAAITRKCQEPFGFERQACYRIRGKCNKIV